MRSLQEPEYSRVWDDFVHRFDFRPGVRGPFPGIDEPVPSVTYELLEHHDDADVEEFSASMFSALRYCAKGAEVYYLDWQHECFAFNLTDQLRPWCNGYPDGDYAILLATDFSFGSFGHPWERTICLFGRVFIDQLWLSKPRLFGAIKRSTDLCL